MMKKVYKKSSDTDQSNQSEPNHNPIITPENGSVKQRLYVIGVSLDNFKKNADQISTRGLSLIEDLMLYKKIEFSSSGLIAAEAQKLEQLGIFTISEVNDHERL
ncbi:hypothetical protein N6G94_03830 [Pediococcus inopinatus]|uniref:hypothetical protein n=1 Tax=Pediococcus inopinatus TaxID=114090 RepID=UPI002B25B01B|nr:hypothetical protein [Pediococcus inopinatus]WPC18145.1 hypothetical protein N6G94_03830 [Pediococcus inopinatus]